MASIKEVESQISEVDAKVSSLQLELGELKAKLERLGAVEDTGELSVDQVAEQAAANRKQAQTIESEMDAIEASIVALQKRRQRLERELHELTGVKLVKDYRRRLRELYQLCRENNQVVEQLIEVRSQIGELARGLSVPGDMRDTQAYQECQAEGWHVPTLQTGIGVTEGELRKTSHLGIGLPPIASKVNE